MLQTNLEAADEMARQMRLRNIGGLIMGPWLVGVLNDLLGLNMVGYSLAITVGGASLVSAILFRTTYGPYRKHYAMMHAGSSD